MFCAIQQQLETGISIEPLTLSSRFGWLDDEKTVAAGGCVVDDIGVLDHVISLYFFFFFSTISTEVYLH